jgi:hypothetical protein
MESILGYALLFLIDVAPNPVPLRWGALVVLLAIVFVLAVSFVGGLVFLLIWLKRRKADSP